MVHGVRGLVRQVFYVESQETFIMDDMENSGESWL